MDDFPPLPSQLDGYTRDEHGKRAYSRSRRWGCASSVLVLCLSVLVLASSRKLEALCSLILGVLIGIWSLRLRAPICHSCGNRMVATETTCSREHAVKQLTLGAFVERDIVGVEGIFWFVAKDGNVILASKELSNYVFGRVAELWHTCAKCKLCYFASLSTRTIARRLGTKDAQALVDILTSDDPGQKGNT